MYFVSSAANEHNFQAERSFALLPCRAETAVNAYVAGYLVQDAIANGAIYALLALALVVVFNVTRVILIAEGEFVSYAALTYAFLQDGQIPGTIALVAALAVLSCCLDIFHGFMRHDARRATVSALAGAAPALVAAAFALLAAKMQHSALMNILVTVALVASFGPVLYRLVYRPLAGASVLVLLIVSVALHLALLGLGLFFFGPQGGRSAPLVNLAFSLGGVPIQAQTVVIVATTLLLIAVLFVASERTLYGKALRAAAINPVGARLMGISASLSGEIAFAIAAAIGAICGVLVSGVATIYYDTGFLLGLKGFVAAIFGVLASFPLAAVGALTLGLLESFSSFFASAFKEVIVFSLIIPILVWRSLRNQEREE
jgi:branched-chain amino acid transport system ATP-binding protein